MSIPDVVAAATISGVVYGFFFWIQQISKPEFCQEVANFLFRS